MFSSSDEEEKIPWYIRRLEEGFSQEESGRVAMNPAPMASPSSDELPAPDPSSGESVSESVYTPLYSLCWGRLGGLCGWWAISGESGSESVYIPLYSLCWGWLEWPSDR